MSILPIEMINKILYEYKGLQHPIASKCKIHPTAIIMKQLFSELIIPRVYYEHRYNWEHDRVGYDELIKERFEERREQKNTFYEGMGDYDGAIWLTLQLLDNAGKYEYEDTREEIEKCRVRAINNLISSDYETYENWIHLDYDGENWHGLYFF